MEELLKTKIEGHKKYKEMQNKLYNRFYSQLKKHRIWKRQTTNRQNKMTEQLKETEKIYICDRRITHNGEDEQGTWP